MTELTGKTVLLTGALGTLGRAQADRLARAGANLLLLDRPGAGGGEDFAAEVARAHAGRALYVGEDLNDLAAAERRVSALSREHGTWPGSSSRNPSPKRDSRWAMKAGL